MAASTWEKQQRTEWEAGSQRASGEVELSGVRIGGISSPELGWAQGLVGFQNLEGSLDFFPYTNYCNIQRRPKITCRVLC